MEGPASYAELKRSVEGISDSMLSDRLSQLGAADLIQRVIDAGPPVSVIYRLTPAGEALLPALRELSAWAEGNLAP
ncbi:helix-turn-helix domain-containing protein [Actinacidiphila glaucinigra]